eukprot:GHRQ01011324.1.p1 GENE.GHRQ01011324.1~~GHRQ01011324.1.p1  ORF type:complete len:250 (+),score=75.49 GHRQ01011324.1:132-881(+)
MRGARTLARLAKACAKRAGQHGIGSSAVAAEQGAAAASLQLVRGNAMAAVATEQQQRVHVVPEITTDIFGAVSPMSNEQIEEGVFRNVDGHRFDDGRYTAFRQEVEQFVGQERIFADPVRTFAYGTDASFYRLNPKMVIKVHSEAELKRILPIAKRHGVPVTFRAAGTSLSGQALTDSVLLKLSHTGKNFRNYTIHVRHHAPHGTAIADAPVAHGLPTVLASAAAGAAAECELTQQGFAGHFSWSSSCW